ncbi:MAG TPA: hypothetical protein VKU02_16420 [Gemmataceae bacterium]|nr:hypothetical protein [Gemmataceae bacterium]
MNTETHESSDREQWLEEMQVAGVEAAEIGETLDRHARFARYPEFVAEPEVGQKPLTLRHV